MTFIKYTNEPEWGYTLHYLADNVKKEVSQAIQNATEEEEELLEDILDGNIGCAILYTDVEENQKEYFAYSGIQKPEDRVTLTREFVYLKDTRLFTTLTVNNENEIIDPPVGFDRYFDTESKILEQIAEELGDNPNVRGTLFLYTERYPCVSCESVINQFKDRYKYIEIKGYYEKNSRKRVPLHGIKF